jgi:hypothetical protein
MTANCRSSNHIIIELMPPNAQFKHSRGVSFWPLQQQIVTSSSNCGIDLPRKSESPSTCCGPCKQTHQNQRTRSSTACTIGTVIPLPHLGPKQLSTRTGTHAAHGCPKAWMLSTWVQQKIITDAAIITLQKRKLTGSRGQRSNFHNIISCPP